MTEAAYTKEGIKIFRTEIIARGRAAARLEGLMKFSCLTTCKQCDTSVWYASHGDCVYCASTRDKAYRGKRVGNTPHIHTKRRAERYAQLELMVRTLAFKNGLMPFGFDMDVELMRKLIDFGRDVLKETRLNDKRMVEAFVGERPAEYWMDAARAKTREIVLSEARQDGMAPALRAMRLDVFNDARRHTHAGAESEATQEPV